MKLFDSLDLAAVTVEVVSIDSANKATKVSGKVEVSSADGSTRLLIGRYTDLPVTVGSKVDVVLDPTARKAVVDQLKAGAHSFTAYLTGELDQAPAAVRLRGSFVVAATVGGGGTAKDLGCVSLTVSDHDSPVSCTPNPCKNGATCAAANELLACQCTAGFMGPKCEMPSLCANVSCLNGGTCSVVNGAAACSCPSGFTGASCETAQCAAACQNGGTCAASDGGAPACQCPPAFTGAQCQTPVQNGGACSPNPCMNGGTCTAPDGGAPSCTCAVGFTGPFCQTPQQASCTPNPCMNNGVCSLVGTVPTCMCSVGFTGPNCEIPLGDGGMMMGGVCRQCACTRPSIAQGCADLCSGVLGMTGMDDFCEGSAASMACMECIFNSCGGQTPATCN